MPLTDRNNVDVEIKTKIVRGTQLSPPNTAVLGSNPCFHRSAQAALLYRS